VTSLFPDRWVDHFTPFQQGHMAQHHRELRAVFPCYLQTPSEVIYEDFNYELPLRDLAEHQNWLGGKALLTRPANLAILLVPFWDGEFPCPF